MLYLLEKVFKILKLLFEWQKKNLGVGFFFKESEYFFKIKDTSYV